MAIHTSLNLIDLNLGNIKKSMQKQEIVLHM